MKTLFKHWKKDLPSSLVVFLVALPLCLGVGLASTNVEDINGMPNIFSGLIAGIVGGIIVGSFSGSRLGVSGPAAGLITIITAAIVTLGSFESFLMAVVLSGFLQIIAGFAKAGVLGRYFPSSVIKGMLAAIGILLILKEIPHAVGYDADFFGDQALFQEDGHNTFSELLYAAESLNLGAVIISVVSIIILILFEQKFMKKIGLFNILPGALFVVIIGVFLNLFFQSTYPSLYLSGDHVVNIPIAGSFSEFTGLFSSPDFSALNNPDVYIVAFTIAIVGSLETLLSVEATDKLDPEKHHTPTNRELKAQGIGNMISGLIGGLPVTQVIVRSSANINTGAKSKLSAIVHGILLLLSIILIPNILNLIPLASLAAILLMIGYKLAKIELFKSMYKQGYEQFIPFIATIIGVIASDLLTGIIIGICFAIFYILRKNFRNNYTTQISEHNGEKTLSIVLSEEVTFLNKASILQVLSQVNPGGRIILDGSKCTAIDYDVLEIIQDFKNFGAQEKNIQLEIIDIPEIKQNENTH